MKNAYAFFVLITLCLLATGYAVAQNYQSKFREKTYETVPEELAPIKRRMANWTNAASAQESKLMSSTNPKVVAWRDAINAVSTDDELAMLKQINAISNKAVTYLDDFKQYNKDYWAPPYATLTKGGDCEDIALVKAAALKMKGWDIDERVLVMVGMIDYQGKNIAHAVLQVNTSDGGHYIMRSLNNDVLTFDEMNNIMTPLYLVDAKQIVLFSPARRLSNLAPAAGGGVASLAPAAGGPAGASDCSAGISFSQWQKMSPAERLAKKNCQIVDDSNVGKIYSLEDSSRTASKEKSPDRGRF